MKEKPQWKPLGHMVVPEEKRQEPPSDFSHPLDSVWLALCCSNLRGVQAGDCGIRRLSAIQYSWTLVNKGHTCQIHKQKTGSVLAHETK